MLLACPTRHRLQPRRQLVGARHRRRSRGRRPFTCAAMPTGVASGGLAGSFDPVWTAGAEGRFVAGAFRTNSRHPVVIGGRILLLVALVGPALGPFFGAFRATNRVEASTVVLGVGTLALLAMGWYVRRCRP